MTETESNTHSSTCSWPLTINNAAVKQTSLHNAFGFVNLAIHLLNLLLSNSTAGLLHN